VVAVTGTLPPAMECRPFRRTTSNSSVWLPVVTRSTPGKGAPELVCALMAPLTVL
jgi:hypothetical protein